MNQNLGRKELDGEDCIHSGSIYTCKSSTRLTRDRDRDSINSYWFDSQMAVTPMSLHSSHNI